jgi:hypothetical protein
VGQTAGGYGFAKLWELRFTKVSDHIAALIGQPPNRGRQSASTGG